MQPQKSAKAPADDAAIAELTAKDANGSAPPLHDLLLALQAVRVGDFSVRLHGDQTGLFGRIADAFNDIVSANGRMAKQLARVGQVVGREGKTRQRVKFGLQHGAWGEMEGSVNTLIDDLLWPTTEVTRAIAAVAQGDLLQTVRLDVDGRPLQGEFLRAATIVNTMIKQLSVFTSEVTRVAREVGTDGKLGGQAIVPGVAGTWKDLTDSVNAMCGNLSAQVRNIAEVTTAVARGELSRKITVDVKGEILELKNTINTMVDQLNAFASEVTRVAREVGTEGKLGGQAQVPGVAGTWKDLTDNVNVMASNLAGQVCTLAREIDHRAKNLLAIVQSIVRLSRAETMPDFVAAVDGRIEALSRAHNLLSENSWQGVDLGRIVAVEIAPFASNSFGSAKIAASGPPVSLDPATAQSLAIALHELATNAVKYGALSLPQGSVALAWETPPEGLVLRWIERGGPAAAPPRRHGFGTKVIAATVERQLDGEARFEWHAEGLHCTLTVPRHAAQAPGEAPAPRSGRVEPQPPMIPLDGRNILLAEDEALIAIMMKQALGELGFAVVGPVSTMAQALAAVKQGQVDGAILDVNLGGEPIYPVADLLAARRVPFVFLTGYTSGGIDRRYAHVPAFEKPINPQVLRALFVERASDSPAVGRAAV